ncbi:MAG: DMT family transporter [Helicobacteraceae bacterium]|nr:DMT family transporter [Helicobacteraceae bacterium]
MVPVFFLLVLCVLFWSGNFIIGRFIHEDVDPMQLALFRWLGAAVIVSPIFIKSFSKIRLALKTHFFILSLLALLGITGFNTLLYVGLQTTTATNALLINSFVPVLILVFSFLILKIKMSLRQSIGILLSAFGVIFLVVRGEITSLSQIEINHGDFWVIASAVSWALYSVLVRFKPKSLNDVEFFTTIVFLGLFWLIVIYSVMGYSPQSDVMLWKEYYPYFLYVAIFPSVLSYYFWHQGIKELGANKTGQFTHLMPLFGAVLAYIFLGERLHTYHIVGALLIAIGIYLSLFSKTAKSKGHL